VGAAGASAAADGCEQIKARKSCTATVPTFVIAPFQTPSLIAPDWSIRVATPAVV